MNQKYQSRDAREKHCSGHNEECSFLAKKKGKEKKKLKLACFPDFEGFPQLRL